MKCAGCQRHLEVGDQFIEAAASDFMDNPAAPEMDGLMSEFLGCGHRESIVYCETCTEDGGRFRLSTVYGDEGNDV